MIYVLLGMSALLFVGMFWFYRKQKMGWIWLVFALLVLPFLLMYAKRFIIQPLFPSYLIYLVFCLWIAGLILPWSLKDKGKAIVWTILDLLSWPLTFACLLQFGSASLISLVMIALFGLVLMIDTIGLIQTMRRK